MSILYIVFQAWKKNEKATQSTLSERFWSISAVCIQRNQTYLQNHILLYACNYIIHTCTSVECVCIRTSTSTICTFHDAFWRVVNNSLAALMSGKAPKVAGEDFFHFDHQRLVLVSTPMERRCWFFGILWGYHQSRGWESHPALLTLTLLRLSTNGWIPWVA